MAVKCHLDSFRCDASQRMKQVGLPLRTNCNTGFILITVETTALIVAKNVFLGSVEDFQRLYGK